MKDQLTRKQKKAIGKANGETSVGNVLETPEDNVIIHRFSKDETVLDKDEKLCAIIKEQLDLYVSMNDTNAYDGTIKCLKMKLVDLLQARFNRINNTESPIAPINA
jgi:hypothetical protein